MTNNIHPYDLHSKTYNFLFHPLHNEKTAGWSLATNIFLTIITGCIWQIPFWIMNRWDSRKLEVINKNDASASGASTVDRVAQKTLNSGDPMEENREVAERKPHFPFIPPGSQRAERSEYEIKTISVMNQNRLEGGSDKCGFHALKNALVALGIDEIFDENQNPFDDTNLYLALENFITGNYVNKRDLTIADITTGLRALVDADTVNENLQTQSLCDAAGEYNSCICAFNMFDENFSISGEQDLDYLINFAAASQEDGPCRHAFIIGLTEKEHWITLVREKREDNTIFWQVADSLNDGDKYQETIALLEGHLADPVGFIKEIYKNAVGEDLARKAAWVNEDPMDEADKTQLLQAAEEKYIPRLRQAHEMMDYLVWNGFLSNDNNDNDVEIKTYIEDLNTLINFYVENELLSPIDLLELELERHFILDLDSDDEI